MFTLYYWSVGNIEEGFKKHESGALPREKFTKL